MKFSFPNGDGETLTGNLELPLESPRAYALFAHCFTCSKDVIAASVISRELTKHNIAVLRFDFTGLGNSEGDFANSNFSSNVEDLLAAAAALENEFEAPKLLIGHSLGGAAVLTAASQIKSVGAVATIGAPSDVAHVSHLFVDKLPEITQQGVAEVDLAGRRFTIKKQFLDDIQSVSVLAAVANMRKPLLIMHSPIDNTVDVEHAAKIYQSAIHPKSFVSLDDANHLLSKRRDAEYAASVLGAWVQRYFPETKEQTSPVKEGSVRVTSNLRHKFLSVVETTDHKSIADEPRGVGGEELGMTPYDLLLSALGACTVMTIKMYADRKGIKLDELSVELSHAKVHAQDCQDCDDKPSMIDQIVKTLTLEGEFDDSTRKRLLDISKRCPVHRTLEGPIQIVTE